MNYSFFTREMGHPAPQFAWRSKFHDFLYKADPDSPVRTIKSRPGKFTGPFHWKNRHFSAHELKRLQSFPDDYEIAGSYNKVLEQVGNSVPPRLARAVAISVRDQLMRPEANLELPVRHSGFRSTFRKRQRERNKHFHELARSAISRLTADEVAAATGTPIAHEEYVVGFNGWFDRGFGINSAEASRFKMLFEVSTSRSEDVLSVKVSPTQGTSGARGASNTRIVIDGLAKYMDHTDQVIVLARIRDLSDLMRLWAVIEYELVRQSRFFSLIDIYGHYANRGDTVAVVTEISDELDSSPEW